MVVRIIPSVFTWLFYFLSVFYIDTETMTFTIFALFCTSSNSIRAARNLLNECFHIDARLSAMTVIFSAVPLKFFFSKLLLQTLIISLKNIFTSSLSIFTYFSFQTWTFAGIFSLTMKLYRLNDFMFIIYTLKSLRSSVLVNVATAQEIFLVRVQTQHSKKNNYNNTSYQRYNYTVC